MTNLATLSRSQLEDMGQREFLLSLQAMSADSVRRFKRMRKLPDGLAQTLDTYIETLGDELPQKAQKPKPQPRNQLPPRSPSKPAKARAPQKAAKKPAKSQDGYIPFPERFKAWWHGTDVPHGSNAKIKSVRERKQSVAAHKVVGNKPAEEEPLDWARRVRERVWGESFSLPGGSEIILSMAKAAEVGVGDQVGELLPASMGPAKALADTFKASVCCMPPHEHLGAFSEAEEAGLTLGRYDEAAPEFGTRAFDKLFCCEVICLATRKEALLSAAAAALRGGGRFVFNDIVLMADGNEAPEVQAWRKTEPVKPYVWQLPEFTRKLTETRLQLISTTDITKSYVPLVETGWRNLMETLESDPLPPEGVDALMEEGRIWQARIAALKSGKVGMIRFVTGPKTIRSLSGPA